MVRVAGLLDRERWTLGRKGYQEWERESGKRGRIKIKQREDQPKKKNKEGNQEVERNLRS